VFVRAWERTVVLAAEQHVPDLSQAVDVVEGVSHGHGRRDRRHGEDGGEQLRGPHSVDV
jgi:hypothetical protein